MTVLPLRGLAAVVGIEEIGSIAIMNPHALRRTMLVFALLW
jgi:hypothetical protein